MSLPPNTYVLNLRALVTLPDGETPEVQDPALLLTGENFEPWPGVTIHDIDLVSHAPAE